MPEWFQPSLQAIANRETALIVVILVLIAVIDRRLTEMVKLLATVSEQIKSYGAHQTSRMQEIRDALRQMAQGSARASRTPGTRPIGETHATQDDVHKPADG